MKKLLFLAIYIITSTYLPAFGRAAKDIPIITTNAHHHSVQYWLKEELKNKNLRGSPLLHFDSHTDMGFIPSHYKVAGKYLKATDILKDLSKAKIKSFQDSLTDISQVIIPAVATGLTREIHMCMPGWFTRLSQFNKPISFSAVTINRAQFVGAKTHRIYPVTGIENKFLASPFFHNNKSEYQQASMTFYECFKNPKLKIDRDYILSLDLDILSTNGKEHDHARPTSFLRSKGNIISQKEMILFKERIKKIKRIILDLKEKGINPKIVTIAESTGDIGGDYTPGPLAKMADIEFREFFKKHF